MKLIPSSDPPAPTPRVDPLIVDRLPPERLATIWAYIEQHGGSWTALADGGYLITFPAGTQQWQESKDERTETHLIQFPDGALITWYKSGRMSPITGLPQGMRYGINLDGRQ